MGRHRATAAGLLARAEANRNKRGVHKERDQVKDAKKHNSNTKTNHNGTLRRYVLWQLAEIEHDHCATRVACSERRRLVRIMPAT
jgi:hypothetical protein